MRQIVLSLLVDNNPGVLARVAALFSRRGYNIDSITADKKEKQEIIAIADIFRAKVVDVAANSLMIELNGNQNKLDAFLNLMADFEVLEMVRTGITGLGRGVSTLN